MSARNGSGWTRPGPSRTLILAQLVNTLGNGAFLTTSALYFTRVVGFSAGGFGLALSVAGIAGLLAGVPCGHLADRRGARGTAAGLMALAGLATAAYTVVESYALFLLAAVLYALFDRGGHAARQALVAAVRSGEDLVAVRAQLRAVTNIGVSVGALLGGAALQWDTAAAYRTVLAADAASFVLCAAVLLRLPHTPPTDRGGAKGEPRLTVLRDRPYAVLSLLNAVMLLYIPILEVVVPLWVAGHTDAPKALVAVLFLVNTVTVVLLQVRISRGIDDLARSVRAFRLAGAALLACCAVFAASAGRGAVAASVLLLVAAGLYVVGEMVQSAASWVIGFDLAPAARQGQYQGLFNTGIAASQMVGPAVLALLLVDWGAPGWLLLGAVFFGTGLAMGPAVRWAQRTRAHAAGAEAATTTPVEVP